MSSDKVVLSFHECLLRESDVEILKHPRWLNDTLISFFFEYLETVRFKNNASILFVSPEVTQCIKLMSPTEMPIFLEPLAASEKDFIFFALNDNEQTECSGGSHWSLLVFSHPEKLLYHFDSHRGSNFIQARELGGKILKYFDIAHHKNIIEVDTVQQSNGYDCGVHVLCNAEHVALHTNQYHRIAGCGLVEKIKVSNKRHELLELIYSLKNQC